MCVMCVPLEQCLSLPAIKIQVDSNKLELYEMEVTNQADTLQQYVHLLKNRTDMRGKRVALVVNGERGDLLCAEQRMKKIDVQTKSIKVKNIFHRQGSNITMSSYCCILNI